MSYESDFWNKIDIGNLRECWLWKLSTRSGYGAAYRGNYDGIEAAHRIAWRITFGEIPSDRLVLHKCDVRLCCNPFHLYLGTYVDNIRDRNERNPITSEVFGFGKAKLSANEILLIRDLDIIKPNRSIRKFSAKTVAKMFNISYGTIYNIWKSNKYLCKEGYYI